MASSNFRRTTAKFVGAFLVFIAWLVTTLVSNSARDKTTRMNDVAMELSTLQRLSTLANDHHELFKDLATLTQFQASSMELESPAFEQVNQLSLLQRIAALGTPLAGAAFTAQNLEQHARSLPNVPLRDSVAVLAEQTRELQSQFDSIVGSIQRAFTDPSGVRLADERIAALQADLQPMIRQHHKLEQLALHFFRRLDQEATVQSARQQRTAEISSVAASIAFAIGTILLLLSDWIEVREHRPPKAAASA